MFTQTTTMPLKFIKYKDQIVSVDNIKSVERKKSITKGEGGSIIFRYHTTAGITKLHIFEDQPLDECWEDVQVILGFDV